MVHPSTTRCCVVTLPEELAGPPRVPWWSRSGAGDCSAACWRGWSVSAGAMFRWLRAASLAAALEVGAPVDIGAIRSIASPWVPVRSRQLAEEGAAGVFALLSSPMRPPCVPAGPSSTITASSWSPPVLALAYAASVLHRGGLRRQRRASRRLRSQALGLSADGRAPGGSRQGPLPRSDGTRDGRSPDGAGSLSAYPHTILRSLDERSRVMRCWLSGGSDLGP